MSSEDNLKKVVCSVLVGMDNGDLKYSKVQQYLKQGLEGSGTGMYDPRDSDLLNHINAMSDISLFLRDKQWFFVINSIEYGPFIHIREAMVTAESMNIWCN